MKFGDEGTPAAKPAKKASRPAKNYDNEIRRLTEEIERIHATLADLPNMQEKAIPAKLIGEIEVLTNKVETSLGKAKNGNGAVAKAWREVKSWVETF